MSDQQQPAKVTLKERIVIETWDGDPPAEGENKPPKEVIVYEDGEKIVHQQRKEP